MEVSYQTGALIPNSTQVPDIILDRWMAVLSGAEFKIILYVARRTYGFRRASDDISLAQMATGIVTRDGRRLDSGTGLSKDTVTGAVASLVDKGILIRTRHTDDRGRDLPNTYSINLGAELGPKENPPTGVGKSDPTLKPDTGGSENPTPPTEKSDSPQSENLTGEGGENPTHNIQGDKQGDIQLTTTERSPDPVVVFSDENEDQTVGLVTEIVKSQNTALSIIRESGASTAHQQALWWPERTAAKSAHDSGAVFRTACRANWPAPLSAEKPASTSSRRTYVSIPTGAPNPEPIPAPIDWEAQYEMLSNGEKLALQELVWEKAIHTSPAPIRARIEAASKSEKPPSDMIQAILRRHRNVILAERREAKGKLA